MLKRKPKNSSSVFDKSNESNQPDILKYQVTREEKTELSKDRDNISRGFVTAAIILSSCGIFMFTVVWGAVTGDWEPLKKFIDTGYNAFVLGYLLKHFFG